MIIFNFIAKISRPMRMSYKNIIRHRIMRNNAKIFKKKLQETKGCKRIIYLGITQHKNLGDLAQFFCIKHWIESYCKDYKLIMLDAPTIVCDNYNDSLESLMYFYKHEDVIVFQSGYTTQDLGGVHDLMHRMVATRLPNARILMMPQTIFFQYKENKENTAKKLNLCSNMLFLARDYTSYETAKEMFPDINVKVYPDIVTSLIGSYHFKNKRDKIFLCRRNDGEKFYPEEDLLALKNELQKLAPVDMGDTQSHTSLNKILLHLQTYIENEIERYSHYKVTITDRYHGTIFSLCAGTPVVIIKTTDHKVISGADWFKGIYDGYVTVANDLDDAYRIAERIIKEKNEYSMLKPYFATTYYGATLRKLMDNI